MSRREREGEGCRAVGRALAAMVAGCGGSGEARSPLLARLALIQRLLERELVVRAQLGTSPLGMPLLSPLTSCPLPHYQYLRPSTSAFTT